MTSMCPPRSQAFTTPSIAFDHAPSPVCPPSRPCTAALQADCFHEPRASVGAMPSPHCVAYPLHEECHYASPHASPHASQLASPCVPPHTTSTAACCCTSERLEEWREQVDRAFSLLPDTRSCRTEAWQIRDDCGRMHEVGRSPPSSIPSAASRGGLVRGRASYFYAADLWSSPC